MEVSVAWPQANHIASHRSPFDPEKWVVKRVIGVEGDTIRTREPYPHSLVKVPLGHIWVEGDSPTGETLDSNYYGPISTQLVAGRLTHIIWPWKKAGRIDWEHYSRTAWGRPGQQHH